MDIRELKQAIQDGKIGSFYVFSGDEWEVQNIYIKQIVKVKNCAVRRVGGFADIYAQLKSRSFLADSFVYVVRDDKDLLSNEKLWAEIKDGLVGESVLILVLSTVDKRLKFYKQFKDKYCEFEPLPENMLKKYIKRLIDLSDENCVKLIDICESSYGRILLEIDKMKQYGGNADTVFKKFVADGTIHRPPKDAIFDLAEAVMGGYMEKSFDLYNQCVERGENTLAILTVLYNSIKQTLQVQSCKSADVTKATGLPLWLVNKTRANINVYTDAELVKAMQHIHSWEKGIKLGYRDEKNAVPIILSKLFLS